MIKQGNFVKVLEPFDEVLPDVYQVTEVKTDKDKTSTIDVGGEPRDFASKFLEVVEAPSNGDNNT